MFEFEEDLLHRFVDAEARGINRQFRPVRHFVGIRHAGEFGNQAGARLGVQALAVARFAGCGGSRARFST